MNTDVCGNEVRSHDNLRLLTHYKLVASVLKAQT